MPENQPAGAAATVDVKHFVPTSKLAPYNGTTKIDDYIAKVEIVATASGWGDAITASQVCCNLEGEALVFLNSLRQDATLDDTQATKYTSWNLGLKPALLTRFKKDKSIIGIRKTLKELIQGPTESPEAFFYRAKTELYQVKYSETAAVTHGWKTSFEEDLTQYYMAGLKEEIRIALEKEPDLTTIDKIRKKATAIWLTTKSRSAPMEEIKNPDRQPKDNKGDGKICEYCKKPGHDILVCFTLRRKQQEVNSGPS